jgi:hypothetical protein
MHETGVQESNLLMEIYMTFALDNIPPLLSSCPPALNSHKLRLLYEDRLQIKARVEAFLKKFGIKEHSIIF